jgi:tetratricopeptide (TPR) repeat protein
MKKEHIGYLWWCVVVLPAVLIACSGKVTPYKPTLPESMKGLEKQLYFTEGLKHYELQDLSMANAFFRQALKADPTCDACYYKLAEIYLQSRLPKEAVTFSRAAAALDTANVWYLILLGKAYSANRDTDKAIATFETIVKRHPQHTELYYHLAALYAEKKQPEKALALLDTLEKKSGIDEETLLLRYEILHRQGKSDAAFEALTTLGAYTSDVRVWSILGETYNKLGDDTLALTYFQKAIEVAPDYPPALFGEVDIYRRRQLFDIYFQKLYALYDNKEVSMDIKIEYLSALLKVSQFVSTFKPQLDTLFVGLRATPDSLVEPLYGGFLLQTGASDSALVVFKNATQYFKTDTSSWETYLGFLYYRKSWDSLAVYASEAITVFPRHIGFITLKAVALWQTDDVRAAINLLEKTLALTKDDPTQTLHIYSFLGDLYQAENNSKKAFYYYEKALVIDSANIPVLNNYAYALSETGKRMEEAYDMSRKTITAEPDNATYLDTFGWILYKLKKFIEAKAIFRHAMIYGGMDSAVILDHYGDVLHALGENDTALVYWEMSYKKEPNPDVKKKIQ